MPRLQGGGPQTMTTPGMAVERKPHATLDRASRLHKAKKIERILAGRIELTGARILDIGTGTGFIAEYLQGRVGPTGRVAAVDRVNQLKCSSGIDFSPVSGTQLPFENGSFDIVLSNHVIEHVGARDDQLQHLAEIRRVLARDGLLYLAVPNRWAPVEPHFKLPLLSWLPAALRSGYVRLAGRGQHYDCNPPSRRELLRLLADSDLRATEVTLDALRLMARGEIGGLLGRLIRRCPDAGLRLTMGLIPTMIFIVDKMAPRGSSAMSAETVPPPDAALRCRP